MIIISKAYELANEYAQNIGEIYPDIYLNVKNGIEYSECYYFDYVLFDRNGNTPNDLPTVAGAAGVIVDKITQLVKAISMSKLQELKRLNT